MASSGRAKTAPLRIRQAIYCIFSVTLLSMPVMTFIRLSSISAVRAGSCYCRSKCPYTWKTGHARNRRAGELHIALLSLITLLSNFTTPRLLLSLKAKPTGDVAFEAVRRLPAPTFVKSVIRNTWYPNSYSNSSVEGVQSLQREPGPLFPLLHHINCDFPLNYINESCPRFVKTRFGKGISGMAWLAQGVHSGGSSSHCTNHCTDENSVE